MFSKDDFLTEHPICCFCGGQTPASTIDHQPAKIVFPDKHRPKGLEFPACANCNRQTSADETLLALLCRFAGSRRPNAARDLHRLKDIVGSVNQSFPGLIQKIQGPRVWSKERGILVRTGAIDVNQPEIHLSLCRIAAKLALATYYHTRSSPAAKDCRISTIWVHNQTTNELPNLQNIIDGMPNQAILQQGDWDTQDSFFLKHFYENGQLFSVAIFHQAVALIAQLCEPQMLRKSVKWQFEMSPLPDTGITVLAGA